MEIQAGHYITGDPMEGFTPCPEVEHGSPLAVPGRNPVEVQTQPMSRNPANRLHPRILFLDHAKQQ